MKLSLILSLKMSRDLKKPLATALAVLLFLAKLPQIYPYKANSHRGPILFTASMTYDWSAWVVG